MPASRGVAIATPIVHEAQAFARQRRLRNIIVMLMLAMFAGAVFMGSFLHLRDEVRAGVEARSTRTGITQE